MDGHTCNTDLTLRRLQAFTHKGIIPMLKALEKSKDKQNKDCIQQARKDNIAGDLKKACRPLCGPSRPVTSLLFGDVLIKVIKDM